MEREIVLRRNAILGMRRVLFIYTCNEIETAVVIYFTLHYARAQSMLLVYTKVGTVDVKDR